MRSKSIAIFVLIFLLGLVAGVGLGASYGKTRADAGLKQSQVEMESRFNTVNENYLLLVREYNKLFASKSIVMAGAPAQSETGTTVQLLVPTPAATQAPAQAIDPTATSVAPAATQAQPAATAQATQQSQAAPPVADFEALSIGGTGPLEGPPPQPFKFTDKSTGEITSWEWDFGDGTKSTEQNPEHIIEKCPGDKEMCTVTLKVCGPGGCDTETKVDYLWVSESCTGC